MRNWFNYTKPVDNYMDRINPNTKVNNNRMYYSEKIPVEFFYGNEN